MSVSDDSNYRFNVEKDNSVLHVLIINQFESKFQNMSVLVHDVTNDRHFIFIKGAPERIHKNSINKFEDFDHLVSNYSLGGYRTIAYGYK